MSSETLDMLTFLVTAGAVAFAVVVAFISARTNAGKRNVIEHWRSRAVELDQKVARVESIFGAYPGVILVWEEKVPDPISDWGNPKVYGSTAALASLIRFAEPGKSGSFARRVLEGLADYDTVPARESGSTLRQRVSNLRRKGEAFSATITLPGGKLIEADGSVAGAQVVLWLEDASIRGQEEREAIIRFQKEKLIALSDPEAFLDIMAKAPFPIWRVSGAGRIVWANAAYIEAVGAENLHVVLEEQMQFDEQCTEQARKTLADNEVIQETRPVIMEGTRKTSLISMFPISGGVAGMALDASEAEQLKIALKRRIRAHDKTLNNMGEAVVIFGANQKMNFHNRAFALMFGLEEGWFKSRPSHSEWLDHLREKRRLPQQPNYREWKQSELDYYTNWPDEVPDELWSLPDGRELRLVRMRDPDGGISLLFGDISDQISMQGKFNTLINVQAATLDKLNEGVAVFGPDGRLKIHNSAFEVMWNLPEEALKDEPHFRKLILHCLKCYHDRDFWDEMMARTTDPSPETRRHISGEIYRSDDSILTYLSKPLPDGATLIAWNDVTRSRRTEAALIEHAEAVEAADHLKSAFVSHVSYQLRTPLTTISGYSEFLQGGAAGELTEKQAEYVSAIQSASEDLTKTIDDILDIAAIEADAINLELGDVDVFYLLESSLNYVATKAEDTKISLTLNCPVNIGTIRADEKRIKQVVYNLLSNAMHSTKSGGKIELGGQSEKNGVRLWVRDNGVGIPADQQPQVFESFKSLRGGTGLGLALVERFVARHGGWVELESEEGKGTYVICHLPKMAPIDAAVPELDL